MISDMHTRMTSRGRVTIPIELRPRCEFGMKPGTKLIVREDEGRIVVMTMERYVRSLRGKFEGKGMMERLREERKSETLMEEK